MVQEWLALSEDSDLVSRTHVGAHNCMLCLLLTIVDTQHTDKQAYRQTDRQTDEQDICTQKIEIFIFIQNY